MKKIVRILSMALILSVLLSFNGLAMVNGDLVLPSPATELKTGDKAKNSKWVWLNDNECVRFNVDKDAQLSDVQLRADLSILSRWVEPDGSKLKTRDTYAGKWTQSSDGTWSFAFDDCTIPVGATKIDGVLYAFDGYGELQDGYKYWSDQKTGADGLITCDTQDFKDWLATQYLPDCTSHK